MFGNEWCNIWTKELREKESEVRDAERMQLLFLLLPENGSTDAKLSSTILVNCTQVAAYVELCTSDDARAVSRHIV